MEKIKPLKKFGQNYLTDQNILNKIAAEIDPNQDDLMVEIGPGTGALTQKLAPALKKLNAVEVDTRVIEQLKLRFSNLNILNKDFMEVELKEFLSPGSGKLRVAGNIPYNLTSPILFKMLENREIISDAVLLVQLEVAQRMTAKKGSKDYGILSVLLNYFTDTKLCFKVSPNVFFPKPKVFSAVVHIFFKEQSKGKEFDRYFIKTVKAAFGNRRKTLKNSLSNSIFKDIDFSASGIDLTLRAEQLNSEDYIILTEFICRQQSGG